MNPINTNSPPGFRATAFQTSTEELVAPSSGPTETQVVTDSELPPVPSGQPKTGSSGPTQDLDDPGEVPTSQQLQETYDAINWDNPSLESIMKLLVGIFQKLKKANNEAKWAEANLQMQSLMNEAKNMKSAALGAMWAKIGGALVSITASSVSLGSNISQMKQINKLTHGTNASLKDAAGNTVLDDSAFRLMQTKIGNIQVKGAVNNAAIDIFKALGQGGEAIAQNAADQYNVEAKKDAAEATMRGANRDSVQQGEQTSDENIRKTQEILQSLLQLAAETERAVAQRV